jgi:hypothetical protein
VEEQVDWCLEEERRKNYNCRRHTGPFLWPSSCATITVLVVAILAILRIVLGVKLPKETGPISRILSKVSFDSGETMGTNGMLQNQAFNSAQEKLRLWIFSKWLRQPRKNHTIKHLKKSLAKELDSACKAWDDLPVVWVWDDPPDVVILMVMKFRWKMVSRLVDVAFVEALGAILVLANIWVEKVEMKCQGRRVPLQNPKDI